MRPVTSTRLLLGGLLLTLLLAPWAGTLAPLPADAPTASDTPAEPLPLDLPTPPANAGRASTTAWLHETIDTTGSQTGTHLDLVEAPDGTIWVAYRDESLADLRAGHWTGSSWSIRTVYETGSGGSFPSLGFTSDGNAVLAFYDVQFGVARVMYHDGSSWGSPITVAPSETTGDFVDLAVDTTTDDLHIAMRATISGEQVLAYAHWDDSGQSWSYSVVDDTEVEPSTLDRRGLYPDIEVDGAGNPMIAYERELRLDAGFPSNYSQDLMFAREVGGNWQLETIQSFSVGSFSLGHFFYPSMEIRANGDPVVAFHDNDDRIGTWLVDRTSGIWATPVDVDNETSSHGIELVLDSSGGEHLAIYNTQSADIVVARPAGPGHELVTVASSGDVGSYRGILLDSSGEAIVAYYDATEEVPKIAWPGQDADGDGVEDTVDRCDGHVDGDLTDSEGCDWSIQRLDGPEQSWRYTSAAWDDQGLMHIAYRMDYEDGNFTCAYAITACNLGVAVGVPGGGWTLEHVDDSGDDVGRYPSMALDASGNEHIAYLDQTNARLKVAVRDGSGWDIDVADESASVGWYSELALDSSGMEHIAYVDTDMRAVKYTVRQAGGGFSDLILEDEDVTQAFSAYPDIVVDSQDRPTIAWYQDNTSTLEVARRDGSSWDRWTIPESGNLGGYRHMLQVDSQDQLHLVYTRGTDGGGDTQCDQPRECTVQHAVFNGTNWTLTTVGQLPSTATGVYPSFTLDGADRPVVAWYSVTGDLVVASPMPDGDWEQVTVAADFAFGQFPTILMDANGQEVIVTFDNTADDLLVVSRIPWDADRDWVADADDLCAGTILTDPVDEDGCGWSQADDDGDSVLNGDDTCPVTAPGEVAQVNATGCGPSQRDTDGDGLNDAADQCPSSPANVTVDAQGCDPSQRDTDRDGVPDADDLCPSTSLGDTVDLDGCGTSQRDSDNDGTNDNVDAFPLDATQQRDDDQDGYGDNSSGNQPDACPNIPGASTTDRYGCPDFDNDGMSDDADDDDDGDGFTDAQETANATNPRDATSFPGAGSGTGTGGGDGTDNTTGGGDGGDLDQQGGSGEEGGGMNILVLVAVAVVGVLVLAGAFMFTRGGGGPSGPPMPPMPPLPGGGPELPSVDASDDGPMKATGIQCPNCTEGTLVFIEAYGAHYCKSCETYSKV